MTIFSVNKHLDIVSYNYISLLAALTIQKNGLLSRVEFH